MASRSRKQDTRPAGSAISTYVHRRYRLLFTSLFQSCFNFTYPTRAIRSASVPRGDPNQHRLCEQRGRYGSHRASPARAPRRRRSPQWRRGRGRLVRWSYSGCQGEYRTGCKPLPRLDLQARTFRTPEHLVVSFTLINPP